MEAPGGESGPQRPPRADWAGLAALALAIGLAVGFAGALLLAASPFTDPISESGVNLLQTIAGGMVAVVAAYVAQRARPHDNGDG